MDHRPTDKAKDCARPENKRKKGNVLVNRENSEFGKKCYCCNQKMIGTNGSSFPKVTPKYSRN